MFRRRVKLKPFRRSGRVQPLRLKLLTIQHLLRKEQNAFYSMGLTVSS
jgi:hypothetical protein